WSDPRQCCELDLPPLDHRTVQPMSGARTPGQPSPLRRLARQQPFRRWAVANLFARLPLTMNLLALVLVGEAVTGSLATGATLAGISTFSAGFTAQWRGRRLDRVELRAGLRGDLLLSCAAVSMLVIAVLLGAPVWVLGVLAGLEGVAYAAVLGGFRALLIPSVPPADIEAANAIDAVFVEVAFVAGPAIAGALALLIPPVAVLVLMALAFAVAAVMLSWLPTRQPLAEDPSTAGPAPLLTRGATPIYALTLFVGLSLGAWEAAMPARLAAFGLEPATAGPLLALTAAGSGVAGLFAANQRDPLRRGRIFGGSLLVLFGLAVLPTAIAPSLVLLAIALFVLGMPIAPLNALASLGLQRIVAEPRQAEGFALFPAMVLIGVGTGQVVTGLLLDRVAAESLITVLTVIPLVAGLVCLGAAFRRRLIGLPPGVGYLHDPTVRDPASYRPVPITAAGAQTPAPEPA
ncbi:MAG TPA: MFS transporter, partial [Euzebya sp.]|nr:MFS transporter [Euzebya sp.]